MYQKERKQQILYLLQEKNEMTVAELSRLLFTSESSIRRDLQTMELSRAGEADTWRSEAAQ